MEYCKIGFPVEVNKYCSCCTAKWQSGYIVRYNKDWAEKQDTPYHVRVHDDGKIYKFFGTEQFIRRANLRFKVGDAVEVPDGEYHGFSAVVVELFPVSDHFEEGGVLPYRVIDLGGAQSDIPYDTDDWITASTTPPPDFTVKFKRGDWVECREEEGCEWRAGVVLQANSDWKKRKCAPYFIRFGSGEECFYGPFIKECDSLGPGIERIRLDNDVDDDSLFGPCPMPDCPICFLPLPIDDRQQYDNPCCGATVCNGCDFAHTKASKGAKTCPFCRSARPRDNAEMFDLMRKRMDANDAENTFCMGCYYNMGWNGIQEDGQKAFELFLRAADLGSPRGCTNAAFGFRSGIHTEYDMDKAMFYFKKGASLGQVKSRHMLGAIAHETKNMTLAIRHWKVSASAGYQQSTDAILQCYKKGMMSKDDCTSVLLANQKARLEGSSLQRTMAAEASW